MLPQISRATAAIITNKRLCNEYCMILFSIVTPF
jgi:hypothetical protein